MKSKWKPIGILAVLCGLVLVLTGCPWGNPANYTLTVSPVSIAVTAGDAAVYSVTVGAPKQAAGKGTAVFSVSGLPAGATSAFVPATLTSPGTVKLTVFVPVSVPAGNYPITVVGSVAGQGSRSATATLAVQMPPPPPPAPLAIVLPAVMTSPAGQAYSGTFTATGGTPPYVFSVTGGALPPGLTLSGGGVLSGTPTQVGTFSFDVTVTDSVGAAMSVRVQSPGQRAGGR